LGDLLADPGTLDVGGAEVEPGEDPALDGVARDIREPGSFRVKGGTATGTVGPRRRRDGESAG